MSKSPPHTMDDERSRLINASNSYPGQDYVQTFEEYVRPVLAEFFGTMLFVCLGVLCVLESGGASGGAVPFSGIGIATGHGLTIALLVAALADVSGAHLNPAVTTGVVLAGAIHPAKAVLYILAQLAGGLSGAGLSKAILPTKMYDALAGGGHTLSEGVTPGEGVLCEMVLTTVLVLTVLMTAVDPQTKTALAPMAIGFAVTVDILAGVQLTGASMNPARSFGPAVGYGVDHSDIWKYHYIYWVGPLLGAIVAAVWYRLFMASRENRLVLRQ